MNKKMHLITLSVIFSIILLIQTSVVLAADIENVTFDIDNVSTLAPEVEIKGKTRISVGSEINGGPYSIYGDISGEITDYYRKTVTRFYVPYDEVVNFFTEVKFVTNYYEYIIDATYKGNTGTIKLIVYINLEGLDVVEPGESPSIKGTWRIIGVSGELEKMHGFGKISAVYPDLLISYTGQIILP